MITRTTIFILCLSMSFPSQAHLSDVNKGLDIQENIHFSSADQCQRTVANALNNIGFTVDKTESYEQGPTIWGNNDLHESMTKCMLDYDLVITFVIGKQDNLTTAVNLNKEIQRLMIRNSMQMPPKFREEDDSVSEEDDLTEEVNDCRGDFTPWGDFTSFSAVRKIEAPKGFLVLETPSRKAKVVQNNPGPAIFVIGYVETREGKFYMTKYSCERLNKGKEPYWSYVLK